MVELERYRVEPHAVVDLSKWKTDDDGGLREEDAEERFEALVERLTELQELLYAESRHALLVVLQAMDAGGKDSTIRHVFGPINPQGCAVKSFKVPTPRERSQDFLWRIHQHAPAFGYIGVFNRSHYEDVVVARVKGLVEQSRCERRYDHINNFEQMLVDEGTVIRKLYLHISKEYQKKRLWRRLERPDKHWKFHAGDLAERERWDDYRVAYETALSRCSTEAAPWYVIPSETRWYRNLLVASLLVETLEALDMKYPKPDFDPDRIEIP
jgi:PPK2 family polyphosphate:nucleotide phosphotransferase